MALPWIKQWVEGLDDPKLTRLSLAERGAWWSLLMLVRKCEADDKSGRIQTGGRGLDMEEIADALHIRNGGDRQSLESMVAKMVEGGSLRWNGKTLTVVHWKDRQRVPPSSQPVAVAERVRLFRERKAKGIQPKPLDPMLAERDNLFTPEFRKLEKELGRTPDGQEIATLRADIDKRLEKKYGRSMEDAFSARENRG